MFRNFKNRAFTLSFVFTLLLIFWLAAMTAVDIRGRAMTFDDAVPAVALVKNGENTELRLHGFGGETELDVTGLAKLWEGLADFICFPHD